MARRNAASPRPRRRNAGEDIPRIARRKLALQLFLKSLGGLQHGNRANHRRGDRIPRRKRPRPQLFLGHLAELLVAAAVTNSEELIVLIAQLEAAHTDDGSTPGYSDGYLRPSAIWPICCCSHRGSNPATYTLGHGGWGVPGRRRSWRGPGDQAAADRSLA